MKRPSAFFLLAVAALLFAVQALTPTVASAAADPFANGCPKETLEEGATAGLNHNPAAKRSIVPAGATSLRICRYWASATKRESRRRRPRRARAS